MSLSRNLIEEIVSRLALFHGEQFTVDLSNGRKAYCFRGETARADAERTLEGVREIPLSGPQEIVPGTYCFVT